MGFTIPLQPKEQVVLQVEYQASRESEPFAFGVTDRALFLPAKKRFVLTNDPFYLDRVPLAEVLEVRIRRLRSTLLNALAVLMVVLGLYTSIGMYSDVYARQGGRIRGWPFAVTVVGLVLPFAARGRYGLVVRMKTRTFRWKPPLVVDRQAKERIQHVLTQVAQGSRKVRIRVLDERTAA